MAGNRIRKSGALAALSVGLVIAALPVAAQAQDHGRHGGWQQGGGGGGGGGGGERGSNWRGSNGGGDRGNGGGQRPQPAPQAQAQPAPQQQAQRADHGDRGQRSGREWSNGGAGNRADGAWRSREGQPNVQRGEEAQRRSEPQRSYSDAQRNRGYTPRQQGWDGQRWQGQNWDRNRDGRADRWDGNREGRRWDGNRSGNWSRDWRRDNRYNWQTWRNDHRDTYRLGRYNSPYNNWSYRRLGIGVFLQPLFFSQNYWIDDPWEYRLPEAYGPYRWVRYYDDAMLVNIYNGEVADVIYDFFW